MTITTYSAQSAGDTAKQEGTSPDTLAVASDHAVRYSIVLILVWIGAMKYTAYEAGAIEGLVASSPFLSWMYGIGGQQVVSSVIGTLEIATGIVLALGAINRTAAIVGALGAIVTFTITSTFLFSAPGWEASLGGFPALSVVPGQFLLKDLVLLAASVSLLSKALSSPP